LRTIVYIDGFNLYYGALRGTGYKWLDLGSLCARLLPSDTITGIKYFTARVVARPSDPHAPQRQQTYLRALATVPDLSVHFGHFLRNKVRMPLVAPPPTTVEVWKTEEKGSDVNLATHLVADGFRARFELAVVVSNDGDLKEPVELVRHELGLSVGVLNPHPRRSWALSPKVLPSGSFYRPIRSGPLRASQFPPILTDRTGIFQKPAGW
jgi:hypothetical protein